ncbi:MAG: hypothetical protein IE886_07050 [Campylobacterales bacterium]|nr:hypothetical protein [Campylobacterales bacterium]
MLIGHYIETKSILGASTALEDLVRLMPKTATRLNQDGTSENVDVSTLQPGDLILVRPGENIAADGTVEAGESTVNEALLTGESKPVFKTAGATLFVGALNLDSALEDDETLLAYAAVLEQNSEHSIARAVTAYADSAGGPSGPGRRFQGHSGHRGIGESRRARGHGRRAAAHRTRRARHPAAAAPVRADGFDDRLGCHRPPPRSTPTKSSKRS